jgi:UDP-N-acetylglucosamine:LPS N-acetylglucosamine transferase
MRVLIFTSSGGTAHDAAAFALRDWMQRSWPEVQVQVESVLENASVVTRFGVNLYNWIQKTAPWLHQAYWRLVELEDLIKPGTVLFGHRYLVKLLKRFQPDLLISTHPHTNRGHFDLAKRVVGPQLRCITCCTELDGGFGFSRNWVSRRADRFWTLTPGVDRELRRRRYPSERLRCLGPLLYPPFHRGAAPEQLPDGLPLLVLGTGANGANNHRRLLEQLLPFAGRLRVVALCGRRPAALEAITAWAAQHPQLAVEALGFQGPEAMAELYRQAWAVVSRPGARTATEALAMGCPLIFNHYGLTMPQELLAPRWFAAQGLEVSIRRPRQLAAVVAGWLDQPAAYQALRSRYHRQRLQSDPAQILEQLAHG